MPPPGVGKEMMRGGKQPCTARQGTLPGGPGCGYGTRTTTRDPVRARRYSLLCLLVLASCRSPLWTFDPSTPEVIDGGVSDMAMEAGVDPGIDLGFDLAFDGADPGFDLARDMTDVTFDATPDLTTCPPGLTLCAGRCVDLGS